MEETFGNRLQQARKKKKITQDELAQLVGKNNKRAVSMWENDNAKPEMDTIITVAKVLEVSIDWLLTGVKNSDVPVGQVNIAIEDYLEYLQLKNEKLQSENTSLKNSKSVSV